MALTLIGHHLIHPTSCDGLDEAEVTPPQHLLLQCRCLVVLFCRACQNLEDGKDEGHEDLLQEGRHLPLPWQQEKFVKDGESECAGRFGAGSAAAYLKLGSDLADERDELL